ncbi:lipopolysaccharide heptosyltransferase family protein [Alteromonas sediminis]|uniref:Lipopolysaccharide heptosyltransferase family protein n=1 Tax=Alteromonas sediminis TaxID=2259342 RepID=A0A3N5XY62_9ALTE|nr:glycosyltransferase family 9 protein [Alteromonas sediminis]RPJ65453.1 lipopolysaccharide heptosyltransferase family protein [Alteromonas sediminis]
MPQTLSPDYSLPQNASLCLLRLSAIGDVCHAVSMVTRIRQTRPDIKIVWVIGKIEYSLVKDMPGVEFVIFDKKGGKAAIKKVKDALSPISFDALCVMQVALRANWLSRQIKASVRLGFDKAHSKEGHSLFINKRIAPLHQPHVLEGFHAFADALGIPRQEKLQWDLPISDDDSALSVSLKQTHGEFVVVCPAASKLERSWLPERYAQVMMHCEKKGMTPLLCGGPGPLDKSLAQQIVQHCHSKPVDLVGKTSLKQMLAILAQARLVISPDTGPAHMATMVNTPVIGLYAHSNPRRTGPYLSLSHVINVYDAHIAEQKGKPWEQLKWGTRAKGESLMQQISVEQVIEKIDALLS